LIQERRPLSVGEILDCAITLVVRNFAVLACVLGAVVMPLVLIQILGSLALGPALQAGLDALSRAKHPEDFQRAIGLLAAMWTQPGATSLAALGVVAALFAFPLAQLAAVSAIDAAYGGRSLGVRASYERALRRFWRYLLGMLTWIVIGVVALFTAEMLVVLAIIGAALLFAGLHGAGLIVGIPLVLAVVSAVVGALAWLFAAWMLSFVAIAVEDGEVWGTIFSGLRRAFSRRQRLRAIIISGAVVAVTVAASLVNGSLTVAMFALTHSLVWGALFRLVATIVSALAFCGVATVFYYDVRVRLEIPPAAPTA